MKQKISYHQWRRASPRERETIRTWVRTFERVHEAELIPGELSVIEPRLTVGMLIEFLDERHELSEVGYSAAGWAVGDATPPHAELCDALWAAVTHLIDQDNETQNNVSTVV
jgi:hypothetical protein